MIALRLVQLAGRAARFAAKRLARLESALVELQRDELVDCARDVVLRDTWDGSTWRRVEVSFPGCSDCGQPTMHHGPICFACVQHRELAS